jgi:hypothetical protein
MKSSSSANLRRGLLAVLSSMLVATIAALPADAHASCSSRYAGPCYQGNPDLGLASSLAAAGGGAVHFSAGQALASMVGRSLATKEVANLTRQYGKARIGTWIQVFNYVVVDSVRIAGKSGIRLPAGRLRGRALAGALVRAGISDNTYYIEYMLDKLVSHRIHEKVMDDIDAKFGPRANADYHRISNQAMYDLAHALGARGVKRCEFH